MTDSRNILGLTVILLTIIGLSAAASAAGPTISFFNPSNNAVITGNQSFNLTNDTGDMNETNTTFSIARNGTYFVSNESATDPNFYNTTSDTTDWNGDGLYTINASAWNVSNGTLYDFTAINVTVDNTGPTFDIELPDAGANFTGSSEFLNITNVSDEHSTIGSAQFAFSNSTSNYTSSGTESWQTLPSFNSSQEFNISTSMEGLQDGTYDLWFNVSDDKDNVRYRKVDTVYVDYDGPTIFFNSDGNEVNATINDTAWDVRDSDVVFALENGTAYWNGTGSNGTNSSLSRSGSYFYYDINLSDFQEGSYTLHVWANDTNDNLGHATNDPFYIDGTAPTVRALNISNASSPDSITTDTVFDLNASVTDNQAVGSCTLTSYLDGSQIKSNDTSNLQGTIYGINGLDFSGREGNLSFTMSCSDTAGNSASNSTLTMTNGSQVTEFPIDDAAPTIDSSSIQPANNSYTNQSTPTISFDITDFAGVDNSSIQVWFNGTSLNNSNYSTSSSDGNSTITVSYTTDQLQEQEYNLTVNATDERGKIMGNVSFNFSVDITAPTIDNITTNDGDSVDGTTWYSSDISYDVTCSDTSSGMSSYSLERDGGDNIGDGDDATGNGTQTLSFDLDDNIDGSVDLLFSCTDTAGNTATNTSFTGLNIDTAGPTIETQSPTSDRSLSEVPYDQTVTVEVSDGGAGFSDSLSESDLGLDPTFGGNDVSDSDYDVTIDSSDDTIEITWTQSDVGTGTHDISLFGGSTWTVDDAVNNDLDISEWSYEVSESTATTQTQDTTTSADLSITNFPDSITIVPGRQRAIDLTVENNGDASADATVTVTVSGSGLTATSTPSDFTVDSGNDHDLDLDLEAADDFSGSADVTLEISYGSNTETATLQVDANEGSPELSITDAPDEISLLDNGTANFSATVENTGSTRALDLEPTVTGFTVDSSDPETLTVRSGQSSTMSIVIGPGGNDVGSYNATLRFSNDDQTVTRDITVKVQPSDDETRQNITIQLSELEEQVNDVSNETEREELQQLVQDAQSAIASEDYAEAASIRDQIQQRLQQTQTQDDEGLPILLILGALGIFILAAGGLAYIFLIRPEQSTKPGQDDEGSSSTTVSETTNRVEHIGKQILTVTDNIIEAIERGIDRIIDAVSGESEETYDEDEEDVEVDRKKIRFDEV